LNFREDEGSTGELPFCVEVSRVREGVVGTIES